VTVPTSGTRATPRCCGSGGGGLTLATARTRELSSFAMNSRLLTVVTTCNRCGGGQMSDRSAQPPHRQEEAHRAIPLRFGPFRNAFRTGEIFVAVVRGLQAAQTT